MSKAGKGDTRRGGQRDNRKPGLGGPGATGRTCLFDWEEVPLGDPEEERL